jgi:hypothetical protein
MIRRRFRLADFLLDGVPGWAELKDEDMTATNPRTATAATMVRNHFILLLSARIIRVLSMADMGTPDAG